MGRTLFDKLWESHIIKDLGDGNALIYIDRCYLHDLTGPLALQQLKERNYVPFHVNQLVASCDHTIAASPGRTKNSTEASRHWIPIFEDACKQYGITYYGPNDDRQGIVHVIGPERGLSLPGTTIVCGDSHTCTHGALGALAWGVGTSDLAHAIATRTLVVKRPRTLLLNLVGQINNKRIDAMDIGLFLLSKLGSDFGNGYAIEYAGEVVENMSMEDRMTICNLTVELGSEFGLISPDETTYSYLKTCPDAPKDKDFKDMYEYCINICSDDFDSFHRVVTIDVSDVQPQISWGVSPSHTSSISAGVPKDEHGISNCKHDDFVKALEYMGLEPGMSLEGIPIERVFIGSCSNGRISNLLRVADFVRGKTVASHVEAWIVPGSMQVKREAESLGLDIIFKDAGFLWGEPSCSLCSGSSGECVAPFHRCVSTSNRNFMGRQGSYSRTHLSGPLTAAKAAIYGFITTKED